MTTAPIHALDSGATQAQHYLLARRKILFAAMFCYLFFYTGRQTIGFAIPGMLIVTEN